AFANTPCAPYPPIPVIAGATTAAASAAATMASNALPPCASTAAPTFSAVGSPTIRPAAVVASAEKSARDAADAPIAKAPVYSRKRRRETVIITPSQLQQPPRVLPENLRRHILRN